MVERLRKGRSAAAATKLDALQRGEAVDVLVLKQVTELPDECRAGRLVLEGDWTSLPARLACRELAAGSTAITEVPAGAIVTDRLALPHCLRLTTLPAGLHAVTIDLAGCTRLRALPPGLSANFLDLTGCEGLERLPDDLRVTLGRLVLRDCRRIRALPESLGPLATLDVAGCPLLDALPERLVVRSRLDIGGTAISSLPPGCAARIAFEPETISGREILDERNSERRRAMLDRVGFERFLREVDAEVLHEDTDAGGPRRLLRVELEGDEDLVCVSVICPSTGRPYLLRVPPQIRTCHAAVAWTAGFDDPSLYRPKIET